MNQFDVQCECGAKIVVKASSAGTLRECHACHRQFAIPALSVLSEHAQRGQAAPVSELREEPATTSNVERTELSESYFANFYGEISPEGRISASAFENYAGVIARISSSFFEQLDSSSSFEAMISCAVFPEGKVFAQVETQPINAGDRWASALEALICETLPPPVHDGPVAFWFYRRMNKTVSQIGVQAFRQLLPRMEEIGVDAALIQAAGFQPPADPVPADAVSPSLWQRMRNRFHRSSKPARREPTVRELYDGMSEWLRQADERFAHSTIAELRRAIKHDADIDRRIALAGKYAEAEEWAEAIAVYSFVIDCLEPSYAQLYGRRGHVHTWSDNSQAALADFNQAIELAPFESWYYMRRAEIYSALEAWPQAEQDLNTAHELAPREPVYLAFRAGIRLELKRYEQAIEDLQTALRLDPYSAHIHGQLAFIYQETELRDLNRAIEHLSAAIELIPEEQSFRNPRALAYAHVNKFELALADCDDVIKQDSESAIAHGIRGRVLQIEGEYEEAIESCTRSIDLGIRWGMVYVARAISYLSTQQAELAAIDCHEALELDPNDALAHHLLGTLRMQDGEYDAAMEAFAKARELAPQWNEPREHLALIHRMQENPQAAVDEQTALISQQPRNSANYVNRAYAYAQLGNFEDAQHDFDRACELDPDNEHVYFQRGLFWYERQEFDLALADFNRSLSISCDLDAARMHRAMTLVYLRRQDESLDDFAQLITKYPDQPHAYAERNFALQMIGRAAAADEDLERLHELIPETSEQSTVQSMFANAFGLRNRGEYEEASKVAEEIISMSAENPKGYEVRAAVHWDLEQYVEALEDFTRAMELEPGRPDQYSSRGQVQAEMGEWSAALDELDVAIDLSRKAGANLTLAYALSGRAFALAGLGRMDEASDDYSESVRLCPTNPWVYYHRGMVMYQRGDHREAKVLLEMALALEDPPLPPRKMQRVQTALETLSRTQSS